MELVPEDSQMKAARIALNGTTPFDKPVDDRADRPRYFGLTAKDLRALPWPTWIVRDVIPSRSIGMMFGGPGSAKSFLAMDLAAHVTRGAPFYGHNTRQLPVTYVVQEGQTGFKQRVMAWETHHQIDLPDTLRFVMEPFSIASADCVQGLIEFIKHEDAGDGIIIIDTLHAAMIGLDENASRDMGIAIEMAKQLRDATGCTIIVCHHTGKDGTRGERGHSSLRAAMDFSIEVKRIGTKTRSWNANKVKDGADDDGDVPFCLTVVEVGRDDEGFAVTSCVALPQVKADDGPTVETTQTGRRIGGNQKIALNALADPLRKSNVSNVPGAPLGRPCLELDRAIQIVAPLLENVDQRRRNERASDAIRKLVESRIYGHQDGWIWKA
ncbi:AAA family ATPase [Ralstonia sp. 25mfcol4.1]|uniref:AAA family ATPase n=1 Tax=Ralstonia sp. 25mfcol4.1 TaxID=1761899 RepID=UPI001587723B|nr:AAA family ATPase [Ralstonia sp. 25mfcol4.1]